jgi:hypothetical protein
MSDFFVAPPGRIRRVDVAVMEQSTADDLAHIQAIWPAFEQLVVVRGRKKFARVDLSTNTYTVCTPIRDDDDPAALGLQVGVLPGGWYLRGRMAGEASDLYAQIAPAMQRLQSMADVDPGRPLVEYYERHNHIELWVPVLP